MVPRPVGLGTRLHKADGRARQARLAAAGLAHKPNDLSPLDGETGPGYGANTLTATALVDDLHIA